ncbi:MAG: copper amine oxidase N-terminal domain-containing protein [Dehalobacter sp.]|nr:copper amine oxidase N-terminal domain-containing protein [Dehalobacter sp.]
MKNTKNFISGLLLGCLIATGLPVMASGINAKIDVVLDAVRVQVDGREVQASSILYNGKTYLGMREVAELVGKEVVWNQETFTANIAEKGSIDTYAVPQNKSGFVAMEIRDGIPYTAKIDGIEYYSSIKLTDIFKEHGFSHGLYAPDAGFTHGFKLSVFNEEKAVIDSVPYVIEESRIYIAKDYVEQNILPLLK